MKRILLLTICAASLSFAAVDGKIVYETKCVACHGKNAELKPLGKNEIIRGMSEKKIVKELTEMKDGTKLFNMFDKKKALMQDQAKALSYEEINAVAKYITTL